MGGLHQGHAQLIKRAVSLKKSSTCAVLTSIFVNPLQFGPKEDFTKYPRNLEKDSFLAYAAGSDAIWAPSFEEIFPNGSDAHFKLKVPTYKKNKLPENIKNLPITKPGSRFLK